MVDCANGAASEVAPEAYRKAGADVIVINDEPDGLQHQRRLWLAAPRPVCRPRCSNTGPTWASPTTATPTGAWRSTRPARWWTATRSWPSWRSAMREAGTLTDNTLVATVMSNLGLRLAMRREGITLLETAVGDRYVLEALRARRLRDRRRAERSRGTAQPRHHRRRPADRAAPDGPDGADRRSLADLAAVMTKLPQVLINVPVADRGAVGHADSVQAAVRAASATLGETGRVLLRPSGTETAGPGDGGGRHRRRGRVGRRPGRRRRPRRLLSSPPASGVRVKRGSGQAGDGVGEDFVALAEGEPDQRPAGLDGVVEDLGRYRDDAGPLRQRPAELDPVAAAQPGDVGRDEVGALRASVPRTRPRPARRRAGPAWPAGRPRTSR